MTKHARQSNDRTIRETTTDSPQFSRRDVLGSITAVGAISMLGLGAVGSATASHQGGLSKSPPMGWNSWNTFRCDIDQTVVKETADAMVSSGMTDVGYEFVNIDDCWMADSRDTNGNLAPNPNTFPDGIDSLADHIHDQGQKLGVYSSAGTETCQGLPASIDNEFNDADTFASWGVNYLKYDNCGDHLGRSAWERFSTMSDALDQSGRDIVFSQCSWGSYDEWQWSWRHGGNLWRTTGDITHEGSWTSDDWTWGIMDIIDHADQNNTHIHANWGHWNDPDMLAVGNGGLSTSEERVHFGMWCLMAAPLFAGNDPRDMTQTEVDILTNQEVIDVNQDPAGVQGYKVRDDGDQEVWVKPVTNNNRVVALLNRSTSPTTILTTASEIGMPSADEYYLRDLWNHNDSYTSGSISATVQGHGIEMFRVEMNAGGEDTQPTQYLSDWHWMAAFENWGTTQRDASIEGNTIVLNGTTYDKGIGTHAHSQIVVHLGGNYDTFEADIGIDDEVTSSNASARFEVWGDADKLYESPTMTASAATESIAVDISGVNTLKLITTPVSHTDNIDYNHTDWAGVRVTSDSTGGGDGAITEGTYAIENINSGKVADVEDDGTANGDNVIQWSYSGGDNQHWQAIVNADGTYRFENINSRKVLAVNSGSTTEGATLIQWSWTGADDQKWNVVEQSDGTNRLENANSGYVMDVSGGGTSDGADVIQWGWNSGDNQKWRFNSV
ncbi:NPCBM/NEW2 domain-containing protein [Halocatena pleomorpha]|uniref:Melibiase A n=1 Tax=Halocatena pleomorpha TaxID=1785090 RepID=A0A3P3R812_9EURY|nr:RICIN domain-containing protein [Halocatena pleomorpha]RRJ29504.1 alpha-galactosidase [Halocatena pleomorpha]